MRMGASTEWVRTGNIYFYDANWQEPAITEKHAFDQLRAKQLDGDGWCYIAFPWASLIDALNRNVPLGSELSAALAQLSAPSTGRVITVCQHIKFRDHIQHFARAGVTDIFASHAMKGEKCFADINIHPFPLYPVKAAGFTGADSDLRAPDLLNRKYLYSFVGAFNSSHYPTQSREWIFDLPDDQKGCIVKRDEWHFEKEVYGHQVYQRDLSSNDKEALRTRSDEYVANLQETQFALCPSGTGPNTIRLWEALEFGCIPVILSDDIALPGDRKLWEAACIFTSETQHDILALPSLLSNFIEDRNSLECKLNNLSILRREIGLENFVSPIESLINNINRHSEIDAFTTKIFVSESATSKFSRSEWSNLLHTACAAVGCRAELRWQNAQEIPGSEPSSDVALHQHNWSGNDALVLGSLAGLNSLHLAKYKHIYIVAALEELELNRDIHVRLIAHGYEETFANMEGKLWDPKCTLITSAFNGDKYIEAFLDNSEQIENYSQIEHQFFIPKSPGREFHAILEHVKSNKGSSIIWLANDPGLYEVWNEGWRLASSEYIGNANIDDKRHPRQILKIIDALNENSDCDVGSAGLRVCDDFSLSWENSDGLTEWYVKEPISKKGFADLFVRSGKTTRAHNFPHCMPIWKSRLLGVFGSFEEKEFGPSADWEYWLRCAKSETKFVHVGEALGLYYRAPNSYWRKNKNAPNFDKCIAERHINFDNQPKQTNRKAPSSTYANEIVQLISKNQYFSAFISLRRLASRYLTGVIQGENLHSLLLHIADLYGFSGDLEALKHDAIVEFRSLDEIDSALNCLVNLVHGSRALDMPDLLTNTLLDHYRITGDTRSILLLAFSYGKKGENDVEKNLLKLAYEKNEQSFYTDVNYAYRFTKSLASLVSELDIAAKYSAPSAFKTDGRVFYFPDYAAGNKYQKLFYQQLQTKHSEVIGISEGGIERITSAGHSFEAGDIFHIHWLNSLFKDVQKPLHAAVANDFITTLRTLKARGVKVYWTVHNLYEHDKLDRPLEQKFRQELSRISDRVFIHHPLILKLLADWLDPDAQVEIIEHGNYFDAFKNTVTKTEARSRLNIELQSKVAVVFGQIRPYKNLPALLPDVDKALKKNEDFIFLMAGKLVCEETKDALAELPQDQLIAFSQFIPDDDMQLYLNAADFALLSYSDILTSGSMFQALSFGLPVLAPDLGTMKGYIVDGYNGYLYQGDNFGSQLAKMLDSDFEMLKANAKRSMEICSWPGSD